MAKIRVPEHDLAWLLQEHVGWPKGTTLHPLTGREAAEVVFEINVPDFQGAEEITPIFENPL